MVFGLICDWTRNLLGAENSGLLELEGSARVHVRATDSRRPPSQNLTGRVWDVLDDEFGAALRSGRTSRYRATKERIEQAGGRIQPGMAEHTAIEVAVAPVDAAGVRFGALVVRRARIAFTDTEIAVLEAFAAGVGEALTVAEVRADLERLRVLEVRQQIARNLHDEVIQDLIGVRLGLVALAPDAESPEVAARLQTLHDDLNEATMRLRDVVAGLDGAMTPSVFADTLRSLVANRAERHAIGWSVRIDGAVEGIGDDERADLLRVLNEAVSNVVRHADATQVDVTLCVEPDRIRLVVEDDGVGPDGAVAARGMGLRNLAARADARRGACVIGARPDGGTRLVRWVPAAT
jgi:signal transduction histidine kinase